MNNQNNKDMSKVFGFMMPTKEWVRLTGNGGQFNGYVAVHKDYIGEGRAIEDDEMEFDGIMHGGCTLYSNGASLKDWIDICVPVSDNIPTDWENYMVWGFDTLHLGDTWDMWTKETVGKEVENCIAYAMGIIEQDECKHELNDPFDEFLGRVSEKRELYHKFVDLVYRWRKNISGATFNIYYAECEGDYCLSLFKKNDFRARIPMESLKRGYAQDLEFNDYTEDDVTMSEINDEWEDIIKQLREGGLNEVPIAVNHELPNGDKIISATLVDHDVMFEVEGEDNPYYWYHFSQETNESILPQVKEFIRNNEVYFNGTPYNNQNL